MTIRCLTEQEISRISGGDSLLRKALQGCINGGLAGAGTAADGAKWNGGGAGCLAGASAAMVGAGGARQQAAGALAGAAFGPYAGSSSDPVAANYENSMDRDSTRYMYLKA
ncbi:hypothetical protein ACQ86G_29625 [Roseateles chitinivorans]|uniref:hypothetical protein n=1 Tax=Roseateles chitinivorans TaxID=2917965 RepID=UPI003D66BA98